MVDSNDNRTNCICRPGFVSTATPTNGTITCAECPSGLNCLSPGRDLKDVPSSTGFWRPLSMTSARDVYRCSSMGCRGGTFSDQCYDGYEGVLCGVCSDGRMKIGQTCAACLHPAVVVIGLVVLIAVTLALVYHLCTRLDEADASSVAPFKILSSHLQLLSLLMSFAFVWPDRAAMGLQFSGTASFSVAALLSSMDCLVRVPYYLRLPIVLPSSILLWIGVLSVALLFRLLACFSTRFARRSRTTTSTASSILVTSAVTSLLFTHPYVMASALSVFQFHSVSGASYVAEDLSVTCSGVSYRAAQAGAGLALLFHCCAAPLALFSLALRSRGPVGRATMACASSGYRPHRWWWEFVSLLRRMVIATLAMLSYSSTTTGGANAVSLSATASIAGGVLALFLVAAAHVAPYPTKTHNALETCSTFLLVCTVFGGYAATQNVESAQRSSAFAVATAWLLLGAHALLVAALGVLVGRGYSRKVYDSVRRRLSRNARRSAADEPPDPKAGTALHRPLLSEHMTPT